VPARSKSFNLARARERIEDAFKRSTQAGILIALYYYHRRYRHGARVRTYTNSFYSWTSKLKTTSCGLSYGI